MSRCIQRLVEEELVEDYQRDSEPDEETRHILKEGVGAGWREDHGVVGRSYILRIIKIEWGNIKPSFLLYHRRLRGKSGQKNEMCWTNFNVPGKTNMPGKTNVPGKPLSVHICTLTFKFEYCEPESCKI